jgi:hypothetical protein
MSDQYSFPLDEGYHCMALWNSALFPNSTNHISPFLPLTHHTWALEGFAEMNVTVAGFFPNPPGRGTLGLVWECLFRISSVFGRRSTPTFIRPTWYFDSELIRNFIGVS